MSFNKSIFPFLVFGLLLQSCGSEAPDAKPDVVVATQTASRELADAKLDAMIDSATPSELETEEAKAEAARQAKTEEAEAKKVAADEARAEKEKAKKEKRAKVREEREKKAQEKRRAKRRAKREAKRIADKLAAEQAAKGKIVSSTDKNVEPIPIEYHNSTSHSSTKATKGSPIISFYKTIHKYGTIEQGDKVEYKFRFKNAGKSELVVMDATASCGCTKPSYPFIPIEPGGEGYIGVIFDSKGKLGRQKPSVVITTNADPASYTIYLEGYVDSADKVEEVNNDENDKKGEDGKSF